MPSYIVYCSRADIKTLVGFHDSLVPLVVCAVRVVKLRTKKKVKIKVCHSVVAVGTVVGGGASLRRSKWKVEPIPRLSLSHTFLIRNRYPYIIGLTDSFPVVG